MVDQAAGELADDDLVRVRRLLEPGRDADGLAGDEALTRVGLASPRPRPVSMPTRISSPTPCSREPLVQGGDPGPDVEGGTGGAERVVLVRDRDPEHRHDGVSRVLLDRPAVAGSAADTVSK